jgi:N utilization substance protein A
VRAVTEELGGEKIDIVDYDPELAKFVANALSPPSRPASCWTLAQGGARWFPTTSSLAIGKEGQNARLAAKLTGAKIDIQLGIVTEIRPGCSPRIAPRDEQMDAARASPVPAS